MKAFKQLERGFTLMELMVVIVIVAILAAVAVPLYINYVKDAKLTEAKGAIGAIMTAEQAYAQKSAISGSVSNPYFTGVTFNIATPVHQNCDLTDVVSNGWAFAVSPVGTNGFSVAVTGSAADDTMSFTYTKTGGGTFSR